MHEQAGEEKRKTAGVRRRGEREERVSERRGW